MTMREELSALDIGLYRTELQHSPLDLSDNFLAVRSQLLNRLTHIT
jgi:hypothetical protein